MPSSLQLHGTPQCCQCQSHEVPWPSQYKEGGRHPFCTPRSTLSWLFFWLVAAWVKSRAERPSVSVVNRQLHVQIGCKLGIRNRKDEFQSKQSETNYKLDQKVIKGVNACRKRKRSS